MGIRIKTCLSIFIAVAISIGLFYQVADHAINTRFTALEEQQARSRMHYVLRFLESGRDGLQLLTGDWSLWNDSYTFMKDGNPTFIESNLVEKTFADTGLAYIGFFPLEGNTVWQGYYDHTTDEMAFPPNALSKTLESLVESLRVRGAGAEIQPGFFVSRGTFHFIAASPIFKSNGSGPSRGWLVMVQQLEKHFFNELLAESAIKVTVATRPTPGESGAVLVHFTDKRKRYSCAGTLNDILEHPTIEITLTGPSEIYLAGRRLLALTGFGIIVTGLLLALLTYVLIQRTLLKRIITLSTQVAPVAKPNAPVENVLPHGNDELSRLAVDINGVFKRIIEEECLNRSILTSLNVGILIIDGQSGKIRDTNTCMEEMVGEKADVLVGQPADALFHPLPEDEQNHHAPHQEKGILQGNPPRQVIRTKTATRYHDAPTRIETFTDISDPPAIEQSSHTRGA